MSDNPNQLQLWVTHATPNLSEHEVHLKTHTNMRADGSEKVQGIFGANHGTLAYCYAFKLKNPAFDGDPNPKQYMIGNYSTKNIPAVSIFTDKAEYLEFLKESNPEIIHIPEKYFESRVGEKVALQDIPLAECTREQVSDMHVPMQLGAQIFFLKGMNSKEFFQRQKEHSEGVNFADLNEQQIEDHLVDFIAELGQDGYLEHYNDTLDINPLDFSSRQILWNKPYLNHHQQAILEEAKHYIPEDKHGAMAIALKQAQNPNWQASAETEAKTTSNAPTAEEKVALAEKRPDLFNQSDTTKITR